MIGAVDTGANQETSRVIIDTEESTSFIVRIWCEGAEDETGGSQWRGSIEQVQSNEKSYFRDLRFIQVFMKPYIEALGIKTSRHFWEMMSDSSILPTGEDEQTQAGPGGTDDSPA